MTLDEAFRVAIREEVREAVRAELGHGRPAPVAVKRADAAKLMGISTRKLEQLVKAGKVRTAEDSHLVPMAEVKGYCAPKTKRERKPAVGHRARMKHIDGQSDEAWEQGTKTIRTKAGGA